MNIVDESNIISNTSALRNIVQTHPLCKNLSENIQSLLLIQSERINIEYDEYGDVRLFVPREVESMINYEYILYHEFSHVTDRINQEFKYSNEKKNSLTESEKLLVMELWNVFIDSRLNEVGLFRLGALDKNVYSRVAGKLQKLPYSIDGKLQGHTSFLCSRGLMNAQEIVSRIWTTPTHSLSYDDMINMVRQNRHWTGAPIMIKEVL